MIYYSIFDSGNVKGILKEPMKVITGYKTHIENYYIFRSQEVYSFSDR